MFENLKLYMNGKEIEIPDNFVCCEKGGNYLFEISARFKFSEDAEFFAKSKSEEACSWEMFTVTRCSDNLGEYYVYLAIALAD